MEIYSWKIYTQNMPPPNEERPLGPQHQTAMLIKKHIWWGKKSLRKQTKSHTQNLLSINCLLFLFNYLPLFLLTSLPYPLNSYQHDVLTCFLESFAINFNLKFLNERKYFVKWFIIFHPLLIRKLEFLSVHKLVQTNRHIMHMAWETRLA